MTKIFEALRQRQADASDVLPLILEDEAAPATPKAAADVEESAVRAVLGEDPVSVTPLPLACKPETAARQSAIREVAIRLAGPRPVLPFDDTNFAAAEQYRIIRTKLIQHPTQPRLILISSAGPGDGKSVTAINLAGALSLKTDAKVLLADTDFRRSSIHKQLGLPASPGLVDVLRGTAALDEALVHIKQLPNLYVITAGECRTNPSELLDSVRWRTIANELRNRFRYTIADSTPVASVADYDIMQATCDGVVLVVRPDHSKRQGCLRALETVPKEKLIGVVMNCVSDWFLVRSEYKGPYVYSEQAYSKSGSSAGAR